MAKKLVIEFTEAQTEEYLKICGQKTTAELSEDVFPTGATIEISIHPMLGIMAIVNGREIGEVSVDFK